jgi:hypothetical protein
MAGGKSVSNVQTALGFAMGITPHNVPLVSFPIKMEMSSPTIDVLEWSRLVGGDVGMVMWFLAFACADTVRKTRVGAVRRFLCGIVVGY